MSKIRERLIYELTKEPEERKLSLGDFARRLLIGFFAMMILLTVVSRAADSVTVGKIDVASVKKGELIFEVEGSGTLEEKAEKYQDIYEGVRIKEIFVKEGQKIKKGDTLFQYDTTDLEGIFVNLEDELTKAEINLEKEKLGYEAANAENATQAAELILERAKLDLKTAKEELKTAKININKQKKVKYEVAKESYSEALDGFAEQEEKQNKEVEKANKEIVEAEDAYKELFEHRTKVETVIANYKVAVESINNDAITAAENNIFKEYYGETEYEKHIKAIENSKNAITRANEDYWNALVERTGEGRVLSFTEKATYNRAIQDANDALTELTKKDTELTSVIKNYRNAIQNNMVLDISNNYATLLSFLYTEDNNTKKLIESANKAINIAKDALEETTEEWNKTLEKEEVTVDKSQKVLNDEETIYNQILNHTYDYSQEVKTEERLVESATRSLEDAKSTLQKAKESDSEAVVKINTSREINNLDLELSKIDIQKKKEAVSKVNEFIENDGNVLSTVSGIITKLGVEVGSITTGTEKVSIAVNDFGFRTKITKDEAKRLTVGDEMFLAIGERKEKLTVSIANIGLEDAEGKCEITGVMPKGDYSIGAVVSFQISKKSSQYNRTIPIQALRQDAQDKYYVLIIKENNTILGNELTAFRMDVTVLDKDYTTAAIDGSLYSEDKFIVSSNKNIEEGDRVRVNDKNDQEE